MSQETYNIRINSRTRFAITVFFTSILWAIVLFDHYLYNGVDITYILLIMLSIAITYYIALIISTAKAKIILKEDGLYHLWVKKFLLSNEDNILIPWEKINNYTMKDYIIAETFIINLTNGMEYRLERVKLFSKQSNFSPIKNSIPKWSNNLRKKINKPEWSRSIQRIDKIKHKSFQKTLFYILTVLLSLAILIKLSDSEFNWSWMNLIIWSLFTMAYGVGIWRKNN